MLTLDLLWATFAAVTVGAIVGFEREYRATPAGLRTHILVSLSCCLLMLSAVNQMAWLENTPVDVIRIDPVRMAHGILTGIGFLCGGVIFREGFNVRGITTAASLWITSTLGILIGMGLYELAFLGTVATVLVLGAITISHKWVPRRKIVHITISFRKTSPTSREEFRDLLAAHKLTFMTIQERMSEGIIRFEAIAHGFEDEASDLFTKSLNSNPDIVAYELVPEQA